MTNPAPHTKLTYADYLRFPEDGKRHELMEGEHFMTPSPTPRHQTIALRLAMALQTHASAHRLGDVFIAPCDVLLSDTDVVEPDLLFIAAARAFIIGEANIQGPPDLVVEILSPATRRTDEVLKRKMYEKFGVQEYWVVDPDLEAIRIYRRVDDRFVRAVGLSREAKESLQTPLFPGLSISLAVLFK